MAANNKIAKKKHPKFNVPNLHAKNRKRVKDRWRKQRGEDNKKRLKKAFMGAIPSIGYRNPEELRGKRANGKKDIIIHNLNELKGLQNPNDFNIVVAHDVSKRTRNAMLKYSEEQKIAIKGVKIAKEGSK